ncbi:MAG TPA: SDR family oxidoreductase [Solirubrobacterales bacterium]|nr:SDR family oxidoreductase [Solirubrobacterales bacterium]
MSPGEPDSRTAKPVLLITGASSGIGAATARLAGDRYRLVLAARRREALDDLAAELGGEGSALAVECDVTRWDQVEALAARALAEFGRIDAVFANAGFGAARGFLEESPEHWESMVLTNVLGPALTIRATLPHVLERGDGHFVITSSVAGRRPLPGSLYSATKFAATTIGEALRQELRQMHENERIKVTLIEPGITDTEFFDDKPAEWALRDEDIAREVLHALTAPPGVEINEILIRPTAQRG